MEKQVKISKWQKGWQEEKRRMNKKRKEKEAKGG